MSIKSIVLLFFGFLSLALGIMGALVPIMPTTPFVLVSAACFGSSSPKLYQRLLQNKYFGEYIENYKSKNGITRGTKRNSLIFLWTSLSISAMIVRSVAISAILLLVGLAVTAHILMIRSR